MMRYRSTLPLAIIVCLYMTSCGSLAPSPTPTPTPPPTRTPTLMPTATKTDIPTATLTSTPEPSPTPSCNPDEVLKELKSVVPYGEFTLLHHIYQGLYTLVVWFVDPALDPLATGEDLGEGVNLAAEHGIRLGHQLKNADICVETLFDLVNTIVVDRDYNGWFSGGIPFSEMPDSPELSMDELQQVRLEIVYLRQTETPSISRQPAPPGACSWSEARERAHLHFAPERQNVGFFFVIDEVGVNVWSHWDSWITPLDGEFASVLNVTMELQCLHPAPDLVWITIADSETADVRFMGLVPGEPVQSGAFEEQINQMRVIYP